MSLVDILLGKQSYRDLGSGAYAKKTAPFSPILEMGLTEIIDKDDQVDQNDYSSSVAVALGEIYSGEILSVVLVTSELGSGGIRTPAGTLLFLDANPAVSAGDTALAAAGAEHKTALGAVTIAASDWVTDAAGGVCFKTVAIPFHALSTLYAVFRLTSATSFNDGAGDDEEMHLNVWYRRDS